MAIKQWMTKINDNSPTLKTLKTLMSLIEKQTRGLKKNDKDELLTKESTKETRLHGGSMSMMMPS